MGNPPALERNGATKLGKRNAECGGKKSRGKRGTFGILETNSHFLDVFMREPFVFLFLFFSARPLCEIVADQKQL